MEPNGDGDGDAGKMDEGESAPKPDARMVPTHEKEGTREADQPVGERQQGGEARPTKDVNEEAATRSDANVAVAQKGKSDEAPNRNTPNKEGLDATQNLWSSPPPQRIADTLVEKLRHARGWEKIERHGIPIQRLLLGAVKAFRNFRKEIAISARTSKMEPLVQYMNQFV